MTTHALTHHPERSSLARWIGVGLLSGALAVLLLHQPTAALLHSLGMTPRAPYSMQPTKRSGSRSSGRSCSGARYGASRSPWR
jgi:hypothetical protein